MGCSASHSAVSSTDQSGNGTTPHGHCRARRCQRSPRTLRVNAGGRAADASVPCGAAGPCLGMHDACCDEHGDAAWGAFGGVADLNAPHAPHIDTLFDAYGKPTEQVGYTDGHYCLTKQDREEASRCGSSLLYGEILATGVSKLLDQDHLHADRAQVLYDLGMGVGKLCLQSFLQFPSLKLVFGIELAYSRYKLAEEALVRLVSMQPDAFEIEERVPGEFIRVHTVGPRKSRRRVIELRRGNMWTVRGINAVDIVVLHTELTQTSINKVKRLVSEMKRGARFVTYQDLSSKKWYGGCEPPFTQIPANVSELVSPGYCSGDGLPSHSVVVVQDQFATSWSAIKGHHLYCWTKHSPLRSSSTNEAESEWLEESKEGITAPV